MDNQMQDFQKAIQFYNKGLQLFENGKTSEAIEAYIKSIELDDSDPDIYTNLGVCYYHNNEFEKAIKVFEEAIEIDPIFARSYNNLGVCYYKINDFEKAEYNFNKALEYEQEYVSAFLNQSFLFKQRGQVQKSIDTYMEALKLSSEHAPHQTEMLGVAFLEEDRRSFEQVFDVTSYDLLLSNKWGKPEVNIEDILNSYKILDLDENKYPPIAFFNTGIQFFKKEYYEEAIEYFEKALNQDKSNYAVYYNIGLAQEMLGQNRLAEENYLKALEVKETVQVFLSLTVVQFKVGKYSQAMESIQKAIEKTDHTPETLNNIGHAFFTMGQLGDAMAHYNKAIELDPYYATPYYNLGVVYSKIGNIEEAIKNYRKVIEIEPTNLAALNNLGVAYEGLGKYDTAVKFYQRTLEVDPKYSIAYENLFELLKRIET